jgi:CYTH domain-containing protein
MDTFREIERKFLVTEDPTTWPLEALATSAVEIRQGYLTAAGADPEVRIRKAREIEIGSASSNVPRSRSDAHGTTTVHKMSVKGRPADGTAGAIDRVEVEIDVSADAFAELWRLTKRRQLRKVRVSRPFRTSTGELLAISIDSFRAALNGLVLAEIEFTTPEAAATFEPPPFLGIEVTHDPRYRNAALAEAQSPPDVQTTAPHDDQRQ